MGFIKHELYFILTACKDPTDSKSKKAFIHHKSKGIDLNKHTVEIEWFRATVALDNPEPQDLQDLFQFFSFKEIHKVGYYCSGSDMPCQVNMDAASQMTKVCIQTLYAFTKTNKQKESSNWCGGGGAWWGVLDLDHFNRKHKIQHRS